MVLRVYVQRKPGFEGEAKALLKEVKAFLVLPSYNALTCSTVTMSREFQRNSLSPASPPFSPSHSPILPAVPCQSFLLKVRLFIRLLLSFAWPV